MLQYYKITKGKIFLQPSWLAKEVGKPTRCAASCQIARGELSLMHIYNTCIIHYDICNIFKSIYDIYVTYTFCYHIKKNTCQESLKLSSNSNCSSLALRLASEGIFLQMMIPELWHHICYSSSTLFWQTDFPCRPLWYWSILSQLQVSRSTEQTPDHT